MDKHIVKGRIIDLQHVGGDTYIVRLFADLPISVTFEKSVEIHLDGEPTQVEEETKELKQCNHQFDYSDLDQSYVCVHCGLVTQQPEELV